jgi:hypothetical protein
MLVELHKKTADERLPAGLRQWKRAEGGAEFQHECHRKERKVAKIE